ncbi:hypothetical protein BTR14_07495 [Rhizobium rhizosphaerae]|uniref:Glycosyltransferase 61 catalytic domain-containing protein n=1 Tax=Xaviernesmea rhizosphaerae TaxID=1672749 RepID=A0ABX3PFB9_9HYPH|nr:glycosyltransferase family 61 protein [Xaviernesmea rhizosphaerae]OQP87249.1 hypothetical protein BTR14_07495 [Xaviernesmea rhizosphaerae]
MRHVSLTTGEDIRQFCEDLVEITPDERFVRRAPMFVLDFSEDGLRHNLLSQQEQHAPRCSLYTVRNASVRGVECVVTAQGRVLTRFEQDEARRLELFSLGIMDQFGSPNSGIVWRDGTTGLEERDEVTLSGEFALISPEEAYNYGMWLVELVPYVHHLRSRNYGGKYLAFAETEWQRAFLEFLGIAPLTQRQHAGQAYRIDGTLAAFRHHYRNLVLSSKDREAFEALRLSQQIADNPIQHDKLFISRKRRSDLNPSYRRLVNEDALLAAVAELGFTIIEPEYLSFSDQISLFSKAKVIVGLGGAGMFNCVFCAPGTKIVTIESSTNWIEAHANLFASCGLDYGVIFGTGLKEDSANPHRPWQIDVARARAALASL